MEAAQYNCSLICWPKSRSTGAAGVKGLAQGHLSNGNEERSSAAFHFPTHIILSARGLNRQAPGHKFDSLTFIPKINMWIKIVQMYYLMLWVSRSAT